MRISRARLFRVTALVRPPEDLLRRFPEPPAGAVRSHVLCPDPQQAVPAGADDADALCERCLLAVGFVLESFGERCGARRKKTVSYRVTTVRD